MKKIILSVWMLVILTFCLGGCADKESEKRKLSIYLWDKSLMEEFTPWLEQEFPEIDFTFVIGHNSMDYYTDLNDRGELPDIITCRRFSLNDAAHLSDSLIDLSKTDVAGSYYDSYINNNRELSGAVRWLPLCAEVDGYIANVELFEKNGIPLPTNQKEFVDACKRFDSLGIRGYMNDYSKDYSCMEGLQGCAIPELMSLEGVLWRINYESETEEHPVSLDDKVWPVVLQKFETYLSDTFVTKNDTEIDFSKMVNAFQQENAAIIRGTAKDCISFRNNGINAVMLPYFGETSEDNWILTYPAFQVAVNKKISKDEKRLNDVISVLEAMLSEEGQRHVAAGNAMLTYNKNVSFQMTEVFSKVKDCIDQNHMYMRLASTEMFAISKDVAFKMIRKQYDAKKAYEDFNNQLTQDCSKECKKVIATQEKSYAYEFGDHGSPAASAVMNTLRYHHADEITIGVWGLVTTPVFQGGYSKSQLKHLLSANQTMLSGKITGGELEELMEWLINVKENGDNPIPHKNLLPVTSGLEYQVKEKEDGTYQLQNISIYGKKPDKDKIYQVTMFADIELIGQSMYCDSPIPSFVTTKMERLEQDVYELFQEALKYGKQIQEPSEYVTLK